MTAPRGFTNALTIDLEDWHHPELVRAMAGKGPQDRVVESVGRLLAVLDRRGVKATWFVLGDLVAPHLDLLRRLHDEGHEIACHGMSHTPLWNLDAASFTREIGMFLAALSRAVPSAQVRGFRAPTFSLDARTSWCLPILEAHGIVYDASLFPARVPGNDLYGVAGAPLAPYRVSFTDFLTEDRGSRFVEFPNTVLKIAGVPVPLAGGFYMRVLPLPWLLAGLERVNRTRPFNFYVHPWELDKGTPRVALAPKARWITYHGVGRAMARLERVLDTFRFDRMDRVIERYVPALPGSPGDSDC